MLKILKKVRFCRFYGFLCKNAVLCLSPRKHFYPSERLYKILKINCLQYAFYFLCGKCTFGDITVELCEKFRDYLLKCKQIHHPNSYISRNSAARYYSTFRALLKIAYKEKMSHTESECRIKLDNKQRKLLALHIFFSTRCKGFHHSICCINKKCKNSLVMFGVEI